MHADKKNSACFRAEILKAVHKQLELYPESSLKDLYKSFFQDEFGPGHLLTTPEMAKTYFEQELEVMVSRGRHTIEPCGLGCNYYRVPMDPVIDGLIPAEAYFTAFLAGSMETTKPDVHEWKGKWNLILETLKQRNGQINDFKIDSAEISKALEKGNYVMHHSKRYREAYNPHYRIFSTRRLQIIPNGIFTEIK